MTMNVTKVTLTGSWFFLTILMIGMSWGSALPPAEAIDDESASSSTIEGDNDYIESSSVMDLPSETPNVEYAMSPDSELVGMRDSHRKFFKTDEGYSVAIYPNPIHYVSDDGDWEDIDMTIIPNQYGWEVTENTFETMFPLDVNDGVVITDDKTDSVVITGIQPEIVLFDNLTFSTQPFKEIAAPSMEQTRAGGNVMRYPMFEGISLDYTVMTNGVKQDLVFQHEPFLPVGESQAAWIGLKETMILPFHSGLFADEYDQLEDGFHEVQGRLSIRDLTTGAEIAHIAPPDLYSLTDQTIRYEATYFLIVRGENIEVVTAVPMEWMTGDKAVYPMVLDPTVKILQGTSGYAYYYYMQSWWTRRYTGFYDNDYTWSLCRGVQRSYSYPYDGCTSGSSYRDYIYQGWHKFDMGGTLLPGATITGARIVQYMGYLNNGVDTKYMMDAVIMRDCSTSGSTASPSVSCPSNNYLDPTSYRGSTSSSSASSTAFKYFASIEYADNSHSLAGYLKHPNTIGWKNISMTDPAIVTELGNRANSSQGWIGFGIRVSKNDTMPWSNICAINTRDTYRCGGKTTYLRLDYTGGVDNAGPMMDMTPYEGDTYLDRERHLYTSMVDVSGVDTTSGNEPGLFYRVTPSGGTASAWTKVVADDISDETNTRWAYDTYGLNSGWRSQGFYKATIPATGVGLVEYFWAAQDAHTNVNLATMPAGGSGTMQNVTDVANMPPSVYSYDVLDTTTSSDDKWIVMIDGMNNAPYQYTSGGRAIHKDQMTMWEGTNEVLWEFDGSGCGYCWSGDSETSYSDAKGWNLRYDEGCTSFCYRWGQSYTSSRHSVSWLDAVGNDGPSHNLLYHWNGDLERWGVIGVDDESKIAEPISSGDYTYYSTCTNCGGWTYSRWDSSTSYAWNRAIPVRVGDTDFIGNFGKKTVAQNQGDGDFTHLCITSNGFHHFIDRSQENPSWTSCEYRSYNVRYMTNARYNYMFNGFMHGTANYIGGTMSPSWTIYSKVSPIKPLPDTFPPKAEDLAKLGDSYVTSDRRVTAMISDDGDPPSGLDVTTANGPTLTYTAEYGMGQIYDDTSCGITAAGSVIVSEWNAVSSSNSATDTHFGTATGNGGDWFELTVVGNGSFSEVDMRNWVITATDGSNSFDIELNNDDQWCRVPSGAILTFIDTSSANSGPGLATWLNKTVENRHAWSNFYTGDSRYFTGTSATTFDGALIGSGSGACDATKGITIKDSAAAVVSSADECDASGGVADTEVFSLDSDPSASPLTYTASSTSSFGSPNTVASGSTADFGDLRKGWSVDVAMLPSAGTKAACATSTCEWYAFIPGAARASEVSYSISAQDTSTAGGSGGNTFNTFQSTDWTYEIGQPTKVYVMEWHDMTPGYNSQYSASYQVRMYDVTNEIEFLYADDISAYYDFRIVGYQNWQRNEGHQFESATQASYSGGNPFTQNYRFSTTDANTHSYESFPIGMEGLTNADVHMQGRSDGYPYGYYCYYMRSYYQYAKYCGASVQWPADFEFDYFGSTYGGTGQTSDYIAVGRFGGMWFTRSNPQYNSYGGIRMPAYYSYLDETSLPGTSYSAPSGLIAPFYSGYSAYYCYNNQQLECSIRSKVLPFEGAGIDVKTDITKDTTWDKALSPIRVQPSSGNTLKISADLTIEEGVEVLVAPGVDIHIASNGQTGTNCNQLSIMGSLENPVTFTTLEPGNNWEGISITTDNTCSGNAAGDRHHIQDAHFEFAEVAIRAGSSQDGSSTNSDVGPITFTNVTFENVGTAIRHGSGAGTDLTLNNVDFSRADDACLKAPDNSVVTISDSTFTLCNMDGSSAFGSIVMSSGGELDLSNVDIIDSGYNAIYGNNIDVLSMDDVTISATGGSPTRQAGAVFHMSASDKMDTVDINDLEVSAPFTDGLMNLNAEVSYSLTNIDLQDLSDQGIVMASGGSGATSAGPSGPDAVVSNVDVTGATSDGLRIIRSSPGTLTDVDLGDTGGGLEFDGIVSMSKAAHYDTVTAPSIAFTDSTGWDVHIADVTLSDASGSGGTDSTVVVNGRSSGTSKVVIDGGTLAAPQGDGDWFQVSDATLSVGGITIDNTPSNDVAIVGANGQLRLIGIEMGSTPTTCTETGNDRGWAGHADCPLDISTSGGVAYIGGAVDVLAWRDMSWLTDSAGNKRSAKEPQPKQDVYAVTVTGSSASPSPVTDLNPIVSTITDASGMAEVWMVTEKLVGDGTAQASSSATYANTEFYASGTAGSGSLLWDTVRPDGSVEIKMDAAAETWGSNVDCNWISSNVNAHPDKSNSYLVGGANITLQADLVIDGCELEIQGGLIKVDSPSAASPRSISITNGGEFNFTGMNLLALNIQKPFDFDLTSGTLSMKDSTFRNAFMDSSCNCIIGVNEDSTLNLDNSAIEGSSSAAADEATVLVSYGSMTSIGDSVIRNSGKLGIGLMLIGTTDESVSLDSISVTNASTAIKLKDAAPRFDNYEITESNIGIDVEGSMSLPHLYRSFALCNCQSDVNNRGWAQYSIDVTSLAKASNYVQVGMRMEVDAGSTGIHGYTWGGDYMAFDGMFYKVSMGGGQDMVVRPNNQNVNGGSTGASSWTSSNQGSTGSANHGSLTGTTETFHKRNAFYRCGNGYAYSYPYYPYSSSYVEPGTQTYTYNYYLPKYRNSTLSDQRQFGYQFELIDGETLPQYYYNQVQWYDYRWSNFGQYGQYRNDFDSGTGWDSNGVNYNYWYYQYYYSGGACRAYANYGQMPNGYKYIMTAPVAKTAGVSEFSFNLDFFHRGSQNVEDGMQFLVRVGDTESELRNSEWIEQMGRATFNDGSISTTDVGVHYRGDSATADISGLVINAPSDAGVLIAGSSQGLIDDITVNGGTDGLRIGLGGSGDVELTNINFNNQTNAGINIGKNMDMTFEGLIENANPGAAIKVGSSDTGGWEWSDLEFKNNAIGFSVAGTGEYTLNNPEFTANTEDIKVTGAATVSVIDGTIDLGKVTVTSGLGQVERGWSVTFVTKYSGLERSGAEVYMLRDGGGIAGSSVSDADGKAFGFTKVTERVDINGLANVPLGSYEVVALIAEDDSASTRLWRYVRQTPVLTPTGAQEIDLDLTQYIDAIVCSSGWDQNCDVGWSGQVGNQYGYGSDGWGNSASPVASSSGAAGDWDNTAMMFTTDYTYFGWSTDVSLDNSLVFIKPRMGAYQNVFRIYKDGYNQYDWNMEKTTMIVLSPPQLSEDSQMGVSFGQPWNLLNPNIKDSTILGLTSISQGLTYNRNEPEQFELWNNTFIAPEYDGYRNFEYQYGINAGEPDNYNVVNNTMIGYDYPIRLSRTQNYYYQNTADYGPDGAQIVGNTLIDAVYYGIWMQSPSYIDDVVIRDNNIHGSSGLQYGIHADDSQIKNLMIHGNNVSNADSPIYINRVDGVDVAGNTIYGDGSSTSQYGIYMRNTHGNVNGNSLTDADGGIYVASIRGGLDFTMNDNFVTQSGRPVDGGYGIWVQNCGGGTVWLADNEVHVYHQAFETNNCNVVDNGSTYDSGYSGWSDRPGYEISGNNLEVTLNTVTISGFVDGIIMNGGELSMSMNTVINASRNAVSVSDSDLTVGQNDPIQHEVSFDETAGSWPADLLVTTGDSIKFVNTGTKNLTIEEATGHLFSSTDIDYEWPPVVQTCSDIVLQMYDSYGDGNDGVGPNSGGIFEAGTNTPVKKSDGNDFVIPGYDWGYQVAFPSSGTLSLSSATDYDIRFESDYWPEETSWAIVNTSSNSKLAEGDVEDLPATFSISCGEASAVNDATVPVTSEVYQPYNVNVIDRADNSVLYTGTIKLVNTLGGATLKSGCTGCAPSGGDYDGVALDISGSSTYVNAEYMTLEGEYGIKVDGVQDYRFNQIQSMANNTFVTDNGATGFLENVTYRSPIDGTTPYLAMGSMINAGQDTTTWVINGSLDTSKLVVDPTAVIYEGNNLGLDVTYMGSPTYNVEVVLQSHDRYQADYISPGWTKSISVNTANDQGNMTDWFGSIPSEWARPGVISGGPDISTRMRQDLYVADTNSTLMATWDFNNLYFGLRGHDLVNDGQDLVIYVDSETGGTRSGQTSASDNPESETYGDGLSHSLPISADYRIELSNDFTYKTITSSYSGTGWVHSICTGLEEHLGRATSEPLTSKFTEIAIPWSCIGLNGAEDSIRVFAFVKDSSNGDVIATHPNNNAVPTAGSSASSTDWTTPSMLRFDAQKESSLSVGQMRNHLLIFRSFIGSNTPVGTDTSWDVTVKDIMRNGIQNWDSSKTQIDMSSSQIIQIDIKRNQPIILEIPDQALEEDQGSYTLDLNNYGEDLQDPNDLEWEISFGVSQFGLGEKYQLLEDPGTIVDGQFTIDLRPDMFGTLELTVTVTDPDGLTKSRPMNVVVTNVNDAPIICERNELGIGTTFLEQCQKSNINLETDDGDGNQIEEGFTTHSLRLDPEANKFEDITNAQGQPVRVYKSWVFDQENEQDPNIAPNPEAAAQVHDWNVSLENGCEVFSITMSGDELILWEEDYQIGGYCDIYLDLTDNAQINPDAITHTVPFLVRPENNQPGIYNPSDTEGLGANSLVTQGGTTLNEVIGECSDTENRVNCPVIWEWTFDEDDYDADNTVIDLRNVVEDVDAYIDDPNNANQWIHDKNSTLTWEVDSSDGCRYQDYFHVVDAETPTQEDLITSGKMKIIPVPDANTEGEEVDPLYDQGVHQTQPKDQSISVDYCLVTLTVSDAAFEDRPSFYDLHSGEYEQKSASVDVRIKIRNTEEAVPDYTFKPKSLRYSGDPAVIEGTQVPFYISVINIDSTSNGDYFYSHQIALKLHKVDKDTDINGTVCDTITSDLPRAGDANGVELGCHWTINNELVQKFELVIQVSACRILKEYSPTSPAEFGRAGVKTIDDDGSCPALTGTQANSPAVRKLLDRTCVDVQCTSYDNNNVTNLDPSQDYLGNRMPKIVTAAQNVAAVPSFAPTLATVALVGAMVAILIGRAERRSEEEEAEERAEAAVPIRRILEDDEEAVSPVIATILMVAITVVLAGVLYIWAGSLAGADAKVEPTISWTTTTCKTKSCDAGGEVLDPEDIHFKILIENSPDDYRTGAIRVDVETSSATYQFDLFNSSVYGVSPQEQAVPTLVVFNDETTAASDDPNGNIFTSFGVGDQIFVRFRVPPAEDTGTLGEVIGASTVKIIYTPTSRIIKQFDVLVDPTGDTGTITAV